MFNELVLITSAAGGQQGKTGRHLSEMLLARGVPVRAFVHKLAERADHVRATVFYENLRALVRLSLARQGTIRLPWGSDSTVVPLVSAEDVARVAAGLLTSPAVPAGATYPVIGAVLALRDIIATFGRVLAREVRYEEISDEEWRRDALARGVNQHAVEHLCQLWRSIRSAGLGPEAARFEVTDTIERLSGAQPKTFEEVVRDEQTALMPEMSPSIP